MVLSSLLWFLAAVYLIGYFTTLFAVHKVVDGFWERMSSTPTGRLHVLLGLSTGVLLWFLYYPELVYMILFEGYRGDDDDSRY